MILSVRMATDTSNGRRKLRVKDDRNVKSTLVNLAIVEAYRVIDASDEETRFGDINVYGRRFVKQLDSALDALDDSHPESSVCGIAQPNTKFAVEQFFGMLDEATSRHFGYNPLLLPACQFFRSHL